MAEDFKPNIYPIMYWGLMYGLIAGLLLFVVFLLSRYLTLVWFPVFLAGVILGGYRNYKKQKRESGQAGEPKSAIEEFKEAAKDILGATREMVSEQIEEAATKDAADQAAVASEEEIAAMTANATTENEIELSPETVVPTEPEVITEPQQTEEAQPPEQTEKTDNTQRPGPPSPPVSK